MDSIESMETLSNNRKQEHLEGLSDIETLGSIPQESLLMLSNDQKTPQFSNEFDVLYLRENNPRIRGLQCLTSRNTVPKGFGARGSFIEH